jgi:hypothetical protein
MSSLEQVFDSFANFGAGSAASSGGLDSAKFAKLTRDCGLLDKNLSAPGCDLIFTKVFIDFSKKKSP